jgi:Flp pilus assembly protein TadD
MSDDRPAREVYREGFGHFAKGELGEAIARYRRALELDPELAIAWNGLSMALAQSGDLDAGIEAARKLVELEPDDPLSHTNLSRLLQQKGLIPEAEEERAAAMRLQMRRDGGG